MKLRFRVPLSAAAGRCAPTPGARPARAAGPGRAAAWRGHLGPLARQAAALWHRHGGRPALAALAMILTAIVLFVVLLPALRHEEARLEARQRALLEAQRRAGEPAAAALNEPPAGQLLPPSSQRGRDLERLVGTAARLGLGLERADYALGAATRDAVLRVEASLPLTGSYPALRQFVAAALNELPHAALQSLQLERPNTQSPQLQATAKLVLFYRQEAP